MSAPVFDLDVDLVPSTDPSQDDAVASPESAREIDEKYALTPTTVNTYAVGIAMCVPCC